MARSRKKRHRFAQLPHWVFKTDEYASLSHKARSLLIEITLNYDGKNNGDLSATFNQMKARGWKSPNTLQAAKNELVEAGFIQVSRAGSFRNTPTLYALTWLNVDDCKGKIDIPVTTTPNMLFLKTRKAELPPPEKRWRKTLPISNRY